VNFIGGSFTHPGSGGLAIVSIQGGSGSGVGGVSFIGCQFESSNTTDVGVLIDSSNGVFMEGCLFTAATHAGAACVKIAQAGGGTCQGIVINSITNWNSWTDTIDDAVNSITVTSAVVSSFVFGSYKSYTPVATGLTQTGGSATITGHYTLVGNLVYFQILITPVTSTAATGGTTHLTLPTVPARDSTGSLADYSSASLGSALIYAAGPAVYVPSWSANTNKIVISGVYEQA
jgi:hypothetical protein